ncbi:MAG: DUF523 domain-containing protein [Methylococcales bacterium]|nr:DUF523 domain-containing protein [Methylococcales bacterium]
MGNLEVTDGNGCKTSNKPLIAVSACLLGQSVRYDGKDKYSAVIAETLNEYCRLIPVCPEVEIGLGVPREKIQLTQVDGHIKVLKTDNLKIDVAQPLADFAVNFVKEHALSGLVLQDKSPSCGIENTVLFSLSGEQIGLGSGIFASTIMELFPRLVVVRASQLQNQKDIDSFINRLHHPR